MSPPAQQLLRVDVSIMDLESTSLDTALRLCFSPFPLGHLLVLTSSYKVLVLNMKTGRLIRTVRGWQCRVSVSSGFLVVSRLRT